MGWRDKPVVEFVRKAWPVGLLPAWAGFIVVAGGGGMDIRIGAWSDPVDGRGDAYQQRKAGNMCGLAKARSLMLGLWVPVKGNRVSTPRMFRRVKPRSEARSKYGADSLSSFTERSLEGSVVPLWMLSLPATRYGGLSSRKEASRETR